MTTAFRVGTCGDLGTDDVKSVVFFSFGGKQLSLAPGKNLVNTVPLFKYVPDWMPDAKFKKAVQENARPDS